MLPNVLPKLRQAHVVVCVDDEPAILSSLRRMLHREPYEVRTTENPLQVLEWVRNESISLVISDLRMPGMGGAELLETVRHHSPQTARLLLTAYPDYGLVLQGLRSGIQLLLGKPWDEEGLRRTLFRLLLGRERHGAGIEGAQEDALGLEEDPTLRIDCWGKSSEEVMEEVTEGLDQATIESRNIVLLLENLKLLQGSVPRFLIDLGRRIAIAGLHASVVDPSGLVGSLLSTLDSSTPERPRRPRLES